MTDNNLLRFSFPAVLRKQITAAFDGGRLTSDGGVMLLSMAERRLGIADRLARCFPDRRDQMRITHTLADMTRVRWPIISGIAICNQLHDTQLLRQIGLQSSGEI